jgi:hypothetical protein
MRFAWLAAFTVSASLLVTGCGTTFTSTRAAAPVLLASPQSPDAVRAAIVRAMENKRFVAESEEPGRILARFDHSGAQLQVSIEYSDSNYAVIYQSSAGLKTRPGPDGEVLVDSRWASWVKGLKARINEELKAPAREAAASAQRERDHQILIEQHHTAQAQAEAQAAQAAAAPPPPPPPPAGAPPFPPLSGPGMIFQGAISPPMPNINVQGGSSSGSVSQSYTCCLNGAFYVCPNAQALNKCGKLRPSECTRDTSRTCK